MTTLRKILVGAVAGWLAVGAAFAQRTQRGPVLPDMYLDGDEQDSPWVMTEGNVLVNMNTVRTARETVGHSVDLPSWQNAPGFEKDVFTFARIIFRSNPNRGFADFIGPRRFGWVIDYPDADLNLSYRLQQVTSMKVDPDGRVLKLTNPDLVKYPLIYLEHPGRMELSDAETLALRNHLQRGGVLLVNDFWNREWDNFAAQMRRVLPNRKWVELPMSHPLFHCVFDLQGKINDFQVPTIQFWNRAYDPNNPQSVPVSNGQRAYDVMSVRALLDDKNRIMVLAIYNSDVSDGWERESENEEYFNLFAVTRSYPLTINILFYVMTH